MTGLVTAVLLAAFGLAQTPPPQWRVASFNANMITYVDEASVERQGDEVRFSLAMRVRDHRIGGPREIREQVEANCASGQWRSVRSWPSRENGREVAVREAMDTIVAPQTVFGGTLRSACTRSFHSDAIASPDRHAAGFLAASGNVRERLGAAAAAER
jgi:hypothetical protein